MAALASYWLTHFQLHVKNGCRIYSKLATNVRYDILTKCCYYLSGSKSSVAVLVSDWLTYKKLVISFYFKFLSGIYTFLIETQVSDTKQVIMSHSASLYYMYFIS